MSDGLGNCVNWELRAVDRLSRDPVLQGYTLHFIRKEIISHVRNHGGAAVNQVKETRANWADRYSYYYKIILKLDGFKHGLFVEMRLVDDDPEFPAVVLVNAHAQMKN